LGKGSKKGGGVGGENGLRMRVKDYHGRSKTLSCSLLKMGYEVMVSAVNSIKYTDGDYCLPARVGEGKLRFHHI
jgi:hypothetical protein